MRPPLIQQTGHFSLLSCVLPSSFALCSLLAVDWLGGKRGMRFCRLICQQIATDGPVQNGFSKLLFQGRANLFYQIAALSSSLSPFQVLHSHHYIIQALTLSLHHYLALPFSSLQLLASTSPSLTLFSLSLVLLCYANNSCYALICISAINLFFSAHCPPIGVNEMNWCQRETLCRFRSKATCTTSAHNRLHVWTVSSIPWCVCAS